MPERRASRKDLNLVWEFKKSKFSTPKSEWCSKEEPRGHSGESRQSWNISFPQIVEPVTRKKRLSWYCTYWTTNLESDVFFLYIISTVIQLYMAQYFGAKPSVYKHCYMLAQCIWWKVVLLYKVLFFSQPKWQQPVNSVKLELKNNRYISKARRSKK